MFIVLCFFQENKKYIENKVFNVSNVYLLWAWIGTGLTVALEYSCRSYTYLRLRSIALSMHGGYFI